MDSSNLKEETLIEKIADFDNLLSAFYECSRGKRSKNGYQKFLFNYGEKLKYIEDELKRTHDFSWGGYREFYVYDPKKRLVMAAPYRDRVVHTAMYRIVEPLLDKFLGARTFACRYNMGNRAAALRLQKQLAIMGDKRYCIKLDVKKYFLSINHEELYNLLKKSLPDNSLNKINLSLIRSHKEYARAGRGIPIGNLTSQIFANYYLSLVDRRACDSLNIDFETDQLEEDACYMRYMDDMVILARSKEAAIRAANEAVSVAREKLKLDIPNNKYIVLANDPVPFLGYVLNGDWYRPLRRNERKLVKKMKRLQKKGYDLAYRAQVIQSYEAWQKLMT